MEDSEKGKNQDRRQPQTPRESRAGIASAIASLLDALIASHERCP